MIEGCLYRHVNLVARDWRELAQFYIDHFGCTPVPPERDLHGTDFARGTGLAGARAKGIHLRLPGSDGTLEVFGYEDPAPAGTRAVNRPGFAHIAFAVNSVTEARLEILAAGGRAVGDIVTTTIATGEQVTWCYVTDPEGNIIELQSASRTG